MKHFFVLNSIPQSYALFKTNHNTQESTANIFRTLVFVHAPHRLFTILPIMSSSTKKRMQLNGRNKMQTNRSPDRDIIQQMFFITEDLYFFQMEVLLIVERYICQRELPKSLPSLNLLGKQK